MTRKAASLTLLPAISIHMPHTWHDRSITKQIEYILISIHMPHTWHDANRGVYAVADGHFNPHATYVA